MEIVGGKRRYHFPGIGGRIQSVMGIENPGPQPWTGSLGLPKADLGAIASRFSPAVWADPDVVPYAARVSVRPGRR